MLDRLLTVDDFEAAARAVLPRMAYDYYRSGADDERTLRENRRAFRRYEIWYRVLVDVAARSLGTTVLGVPLSAPILIAPTAYHRMAHPEGELATARAAAAAGSLYVVSTLATTRLEDVAAASAGPKWFQLYVHKDRGFTRSLVERAEAAGYRALVLTVDAPLLGRRLADERNLFALPEGLVMANLASAAGLGATAEERSMLARYVASRHDAVADVEGPRLAARAHLAAPPGQGHRPRRRRRPRDRSRRRRRGRLQPRRAPARRRARLHRRAPRRRRRRRRARARARGRRHPPRHRRAQGPGARRRRRCSSGGPSSTGSP